jgi:Protein of unknown function (DUF1559)
MASNPYESPEHKADLPRQPSDWLRPAIRMVAIVGIMAVLAALLLLPFARFGAHKAAQRMGCHNHLRQIALALQNYHDRFGA